MVNEVFIDILLDSESTFCIRVHEIALRSA